MSLRLVTCDPSHDDSWNAFVNASSHSSFYHRAEWRSINAKSFGHETVHLAVMNGDRIVGIFPIVRMVSLLFGRIACSMPFVNYGGPCGESEEVERELVAGAARICDDWNVDYLEIRSKRKVPGEWPTSEHKVSMTIALDPDPEVLLGRFKREQRAEIRRAAKAGFTVRFGAEHIRDFYAVLSHSWRTLGTPIFQSGYLEAILAAFPDSTRLCVVYAPNGEPVAGALDGLHGGTVEGMWLGIRTEYRRHLVGYVLYWELIRDACLRGCHSFHLGRSSKDSGGEQFKRKWNAEAEQLYWQYILRKRADMPSLNPTNAKYQLAMRAWRRLPLRVTQRLGPWIAGSIP